MTTPTPFPSNTEDILTHAAAGTVSCADEPIHIPGSVQQHGFFLLVDPMLRRVVAASENTADYLGLPLKLILGSSLDTMFDRELLASVGSLDKLPQAEHGAVTYLGTFRVGENLCSVLTHCLGDRRVLEFERVDRLVSPELMNAVITNFVGALSRLPTVNDLADAVTRQVQDLTGCDRVLLYNFNAEGHGTVLAEANNGRLPSFLDLRFPATDIPAQARALYVLNTVRIIPDAGYTPSRLVGVAGEEATRLDLSQSILRSVSPVHLEYMRNMGTGSSMSVSIIVDGQLWGLISAHHAEPRTVPYLIRGACDLLAKIASTQLLALRTTARLAETVRFHAVQRQLLTQLAVEPNYVVSLQDHMAELLQIANASGVALIVDGVTETFGQVPTQASIVKIAAWLDGLPDFEIVSSSELMRELPWAESIRTNASGLIAVRVSSVRQRYLLWFRPEIVETVEWAGEPTKRSDGVSLNPRASFDSWKEIVHGKCVPWSELELESALDFRAALTTIGLRRAEEAVELGEARFQQLTSALPAKIFTADDSGRLTFTNERWHAQGLSESGRWFDNSALVPEDAERCETQWIDAVRENRTFEAEVRLRESAGGALRWNFVRAVPFRREGAARAGWIGTFIDLTDSKERELALRMNEKLALTGRMTSVIAHEINNPLESITNLLFLLRMNIAEDSNASNYITMAESELDRISGITKQTLRWSRESVDCEETFTAGPLVDDVLPLFAGKILNPSLRMQFCGDRNTPMTGVIGKIRQVLANLVSNAIDAAPLESEVRIEILSHVRESGFSVADNGSGIGEADQKRLFEPFYSTKGDLGNGLGLYISREIVERHHGSIRVDSRVGMGTTMTVLLPVAKPA